MSGRPKGADERAAMLKRLQDGASYRDVGKEFGCHPQTVSRHHPGFAENGRRFAVEKASRTWDKMNKIRDSKQAYRAAERTRIRQLGA